MRRAASCSDVQQRAERQMISQFSRQLGKELATKELSIGGTKVLVDGFYEDESQVVLVEAWAHVGKAKSAQRHKVLGDLLKLAFIASERRRSDATLKVNSYILFVDDTAAKVLNGNGWASLAAKAFDIRTQVVKLSDNLIETIKEAQSRQDIRSVDLCDEESP